VLSKHWQHKLFACLIVAGLIISLPANIFAQSGEGNGNHLFFPVVQTVSAPLARSEQELAVPFVGNNHMFLPVLETNAVNHVNVADADGLDPGRIAHANATLTMRPGVSEVSSTSPNAAYSKVGCQHSSR
jgi:hypothetical protein